MPYMPGTNTGHGHVWERPDGIKARCGGSGFCAQCSADQACRWKVGEGDVNAIIDRIETNLAAILASHYGNTPPKELTVKLATRAVEIMVEPERHSEVTSICSEHQELAPGWPRCYATLPDNFTFKEKIAMRIPTERDAEYIAIANRFAAFFGGRPVGEKFLAGLTDKPEQMARERERDEQILLFVSQLNPEPAKSDLRGTEQQ